MKQLQRLWKSWLKFGKFMGTIQMNIFLTIFYFVILWIVGVFTRLLSDPLLLKKSVTRKTSFVLWDHGEQTLDQAQSQY